VFILSLIEDILYSPLGLLIDDVNEENMEAITEATLLPVILSAKHKRVTHTIVTKDTVPQTPRVLTVEFHISTTNI